MTGALAAIAALGIPLWMLRVTTKELENAGRWRKIGL
jgi:hypothetical protein